MITRGRFISSGAAIAVASPLPSFGKEEPVPNLRIGVLSDPHVKGEGTDGPLEKVLRAFDRMKVGCDTLPYRSLVLTGCGFEAQTERGKSDFLSLRLDGKAWGAYSAMMQLKSAEGKNIWATPQKVETIDWRMDGKFGVMSVCGRYEAGNLAFRLTHRLTFAPGFDGFIAEVASMENVGCDSLTVVTAFARLLPPKGQKCEIDGGIPDLWKGPNACSWVYPEKGSFSAQTWDSSALRIRFWIGQDGHPHGDIVFRMPFNTVLPPGKMWAPTRPMGVQVQCATV